MKRLLIQLLLSTLSANLALGQELMVKFDKLTANVAANNPYYDDWSCEILSPGDIGSCKIPMKGNIEFDGVRIAEFDLTGCEALENDEFAKDIIKHGTPKDKFPKQCPFTAGMDYEISKYKFPKEKLPQGALPDGSFSGDIHMYEQGKDPYVIVHFEGKISHELPKLPGFGR